MRRLQNEQKKKQKYMVKNPKSWHTGILVGLNTIEG